MEKFVTNAYLFKAKNLLPALDKLIQYSLITFVAFSMFSISITQISFAIGALSWLSKVHLTQTWKELRGTGVGIIILSFVLACILSIISSIDLDNSLKHLKKLVQFIIIFWVANSVNDEKQRTLLVRLIIISGFVAASHGLYQYMSPGFSIAHRIHGASGIPSTFSGILMIASLVSLGNLLFHKPKQFWVLVATTLIILCLLLSLTRQAWLGFSIGALFLAFVWNKKLLLVIPLLFAGLILFSSGEIKHRMDSFANNKDKAFLARTSLWKGGWNVFKDYPVLGCGYKCMDYTHTQYPDPSGWIAHYRGMHSNIMQLLVDTGVVGLGLWISIWIVYFIEIFKRWKLSNKETSWDNAKGILMGSVAAVLGFLVGGLFETTIYDSEVSMLLYFIMGLSLTNVKKTSLLYKGWAG